jgi:hypothetical protein
MSKAASIAASPFASCPECGATRQPAARYCWLCGGVLPEIVAPPPVAGKEIVAAQLAKDSSNGLSPGQQRALVWLAVILVALLGFGVSVAADLTIGILYAVAVVPTLLVVLIGTTSARAKGQPWTPAKTVTVAATTAAGTVLTTIAVTVVALAVMVLVIFAAAIAMIAQCFQALGGGGGA